MALPLDADEGVLLQATEIERYGAREDILNELVLTNKSLIFEYDFKANMFAKKEKRTEKIPLGEIKVVNGEIQVKKIKHDDYGNVLQILYVDNRREYFSFWNAKKDIPKWEEAIKKAIVGENTKEDTKQEELREELIVETVIEKEKKETEQKVCFCSNCGSKMTFGAKFCSECGTSVISEQALSSEKKEDEVKELITVYNCPECGAAINKATGVCSYCGVRIEGAGVVSSVQEFHKQLMEIEASRKSSSFKDLYLHKTNPADTQKLALIRNYPVPNAIEDIQEFMLLAVANIDNKLSKNSTSGKMLSFMNSGNVDLTMEKTISDAWVAKMEQVYKKAEMLFRSEPSFSAIQEMYYDKMKQLNFKVK